MEQDAISDTANVLTELKVAGDGLIVCGKRTCAFGRQIAGILENQYPAEVLVVGSATMEEVGRVASHARDKGFMVAVGGGKTIDIAKLASVKANLPFISVPTAASHDGIASMRASIRFSEGLNL
jgi:glycerol-1-phosphate dehydrogenase [NAD(P)+]